VCVCVGGEDGRTCYDATATALEYESIGGVSQYSSIGV
jgi:hypothetical protein